MKAFTTFLKGDLAAQHSFRKASKNQLELIASDPRGSVVALQKGSTTAPETVTEDRIVYVHRPATSCTLLSFAGRPLPPLRAAHACTQLRIRRA